MARELLVELLGAARSCSELLALPRGPIPCATHGWRAARKQAGWRNAGDTGRVWRLMWLASCSPGWCELLGVACRRWDGGRECSEGEWFGERVGGGRFGLNALCPDVIVEKWSGSKFGLK